MSEDLKFDKEYPKLKSHTFQTIRDIPCKIQKGDHIRIFIDGNFKGVADCNWRTDMKLEDIRDHILTSDTDTETREEAIEELRWFYPDLEESDTVAILNLTWGIEFEKLEAEK